MKLAHTVWKLLKIRWLIFKREIRHAKGNKLFGYIAGILVSLVAIVFVFILSFIILSLLKSPEAIEVFGSVNMERIPILMLSGAFIVVVFISFQLLLQALYLVGDMDLLLSSPIPTRAVFVAKFLQAVIPNFLLIAVLMLPVLWGLGASNSYNFLYYPLTLLLLVFQVLTAAGFSSLLVMAIVRIFPARRVFTVISFLSGLIFFLGSQWYNIGVISNKNEQSMTSGLRKTVEVMSLLNVSWSPLAWPGLGIVAISQEKWLIGLIYITLSVGLAIGIFMLSIIVAEKIYYSGWIRVKAVPGRKKRGVIVDQKVALRHLPFVPSIISSIVKKDFRMLRRDLKILSQLISSVIFTIFYIVMILIRRDTGDSLSVFIRQNISYLNILIALFASSGLVSTLAMISFSQESKNYWILKVAPVSAGKLAIAKWLVAYLPGIVVGSLIMIIIGVLKKVTSGDIIFGLIVVSFVVAGSTGLNLHFGIKGAKLDWTDPRQMTSGGMVLIAMILSILFQCVNLALFIGPIFLIQLWGGSVILGRLIGLVLGCLLSLAAAFFPVYLILKRVPIIGEEIV